MYMFAFYRKKQYYVWLVCHLIQLMLIEGSNHPQPKHKLYF